MIMVAVAYEHVYTNIWFLDTCFSNHMTGQKAWLADFDESKKNNFKLDDNSSLQAEGIGDIIIQRINGAKIMIKDVLYVARMKCNLLSVGQLVEKGFLVVMKD